MCSNYVKIIDGIWTGDCRVIRNFPVTDDRWFTAYWAGLSSMHSSIGVTTVARTQNTTLKFLGDEKEVTQVHFAWFAIFGAKVCLIFVLTGFAAYLVQSGARCVVA